MERNQDMGGEQEFGVARQKKKTESSQCIYDGRLSTPSVKFMQDTIRICDPSSTNEKGGFGKVYFYKKKHPELGIPVAIKEVIIEENSSKLKMMSTINEKLASRTLHYAIVPLLAMTEDPEKKTFYFLSPFLENGDLFQALKNDTKRLEDNKPEEVLLTKRRRLKILLHVISALDFLHTPVKDVRGPIIHMDVKSLNIVLDADFNARLIDFGLAREMNEMQSGIPVTKTEVGGTDGYFPTHGYSYLTIYEDYHNFGVVGLECLTGLAPRDPDGNYIDLRIQHAEILTDKIQDIWYVEDDIGQEAEDILKLCRRCIDSPSKKNVTSREIIEVLKVCKLFTSPGHKLIKDHLRKQQQPSWDRNSKMTNTCEMCMINPADDLLTHKPNCRCNIAVCVACMRNSYVNKISCHSCDADITPTIGHFWGALVIVGNDLKSSELARNFRKDGLDVYKVIVSKCPMVMGICSEDVIVVQADVPGQKAKLKEKVCSAVAELSKKEGLKTVLLYYSGHSGEDGLPLENDEDILTGEELTTYMSKIAQSKIAQSKTGGTFSSFQFDLSEASAVSPKRFICFFDCCRPPDVTNLRDPHVCVIQVNACRSQQESAAESSGSVFTKYLIQALTKSAHGKKCIDEQCDCSPIPGDFITVQELVGYVRKHMKRHQARRNIEIYNAPEKSERRVTLHDEKIAYNIDFHVRLKFRIKDVDGRELIMKKIEPHFISDVNELRRILFETFMEQRFPALQFEEIELLVYQECICIEIDKGPKETEELETLEKVMKAWNAKRDLAVTLRDISRIKRGMVLTLIHPDSIREKLDNTTVASIKKRDDGYLIPFADFGELKKEIGRRPKGALEKFRDCLSNILNACRFEADEEGQLQIIIPKREREKEHTFVCLKVFKKTPAIHEGLKENEQVTEAKAPIQNERSQNKDSKEPSEPRDKQRIDDKDDQNKKAASAAEQHATSQTGDSSEIIYERTKISGEQGRSISEPTMSLNASKLIEKDRLKDLDSSDQKEAFLKELIELYNEKKKLESQNTSPGGASAPGLSSRQPQSQEYLPVLPLTIEETASDLPEYRMDRKPRGWCIIINNMEFHAEHSSSQMLSHRKGTEIDAEALKHTFTRLEFKVVQFWNLSDSQIVDCLKEMAEKEDHTNLDCFVCAIMTHGEMNQLFGSNGRQVRLTTLTSMFQASRCPTLAGKPKLFFIQSCQGGDMMTGAECGNVEVYNQERVPVYHNRPYAEGENVEVYNRERTPVYYNRPSPLSDHPRLVYNAFEPTSTMDAAYTDGFQESESKDLIPNEADYLLGYATLPGYVAFRNTLDGSWYIQKLCEMLDKFAERHVDLMSILTEVNNQVAAKNSRTPTIGVYKQIPAPMTTLRKRVIFR